MNLVRLQATVESPRQELFRRFNMAPGATAVLVQMRGRLLQSLSDHPERSALDADIRSRNGAAHAVWMIGVPVANPIRLVSEAESRNGSVS